jgi:hypothetical protein
LILEPRAGSIEQAWVEPPSPTEGTPVTLQVSLAEPLRLASFDVRQTSTMFTVRLYWTTTGGGLPTSEFERLLGTLEARFYSVSVQSYVDNRLVDTAYVTFRVTEGPAPGLTKSIDNVSYSPAAPSAGDNVTLIVAGKWPTAGHDLVCIILASRQREVTLDMHWQSPTTPVAQVETPYQHASTLHNVSEGTYNVTVRCHLDGVLVDWASLTFEVSASDPSLPGGNWPWWPWGNWPGIGDWAGGYRGLP